MGGQSISKLLLVKSIGVVDTFWFGSCSFGDACCGGIFFPLFILSSMMALGKEEPRHYGF